MPFRKSRITPRTMTIGGVLSFLSLLFLFAFFGDIVLVVKRLISIAFAFLGFPLAPSDPATVIAFEVIGFNIFIGFIPVFILWLFLISLQSLLPVNNFQEISRTAFHLLLYIFRRHGQAVFVQDGKLTANAEEVIRVKRGVVVVDFNSAVVLEETVPIPGATGIFDGISDKLVTLFGVSDPYQNPRACGPGIIFTRQRERLHAVMDLRKQFRIKSSNAAYTRDGIEVESNVWALFTIGQEAERLQITYDGERKAENLRVVYLDILAEDKVRARDISDELEEDDRQEIHHWMWIDYRAGQMGGYDELPAHTLLPVFERNRVFAAAYSEARDADNKTIPWHELPTKVATDLFRHILLKHNYDELYDLKNPDYFPLLTFRKMHRIYLRNNGILSFRLIMTKKGLGLEKGKVYNRFDLRVSPVRALSTSKTLRDRGIKVIASGFGDLQVAEAIYEQRIDNLLSHWDRDTEIVQASRDLEAMRIRARARRLAQQELSHTLSKIINIGDHSDEVLAIRILQAIEGVAADPKTRRLLPSETSDLIGKIHDYLIPPKV